MSAAASQTTSVAGTQEGDVDGTLPPARDSSKAGRNFWTKKYSATMMPAIGGKATPRMVKKSMNLFNMPAAARTDPIVPMTRVTSARFTCLPKTVPMKLTTPRPELYRFQSLIFSVPRMITKTPTQPTDEVTMVMMSDDRTACASSTPARPMTYSPMVMPRTVCLTTSAGVRLNRVMSGVMMAPTMKPPATSVVPSMRVSGGPGGAELTSEPTSCFISPLMMDQPTRSTKDGTVMYATHCMELKPHRTIAVTASPKVRDQAHAGRKGINW